MKELSKKTDGRESSLTWHI